MSRYLKDIPASVLGMYVFALVMFGTGVLVMYAVAPHHEVSADAVAALLAALVGVVGVHVGHTTAHAQAQAGLEATLAHLHSEPVHDEGAQG